MTPKQARQAYDAQGYVVIRNALAPDELERVRAAFERAAGAGALRDLLNQDDVFVDMVDHPVLFPVARGHCGRRCSASLRPGWYDQAPYGFGIGVALRPVGTLGVYMPESIIMTKLFTYLEDVTKDGACLACVPGSHRYEIGQLLPDISDHEEMPHHVKMVVKGGRRGVDERVYLARPVSQQERPAAQGAGIFLRPFVDEDAV